MPLPTPIAGVGLVCFEQHADERGSFERLWDAGTLRAAGYVAELAQVSLSHNVRSGTLRGLHYALAPNAETKLVRCVRGAIYDVAVDLRAGSPTYGTYVARTLSAENRCALVLAPGIAHGFQTLRDDTDVLYCIDRPFDAATARTLRYDDAAIGIAWPLPVSTISARDAAAPLLAAL